MNTAVCGASVLLAVVSALLPTAEGRGHPREEAVVEIQAVAGGEARLPCDIQPPDPLDEMQLVIWYKDDYKSSVYSLDARSRQKKLDQAEQTMDVNILEGRAFFRYGDTPATLAIDNVQSTDAGNYTCRVDFHKSPTRKTAVKLSVVVPPEKLVFMDDDGSYVLGTSPRPYAEGATVKITCTSVGGKPLPSVTWWRDDTLLDDSFQALPSGRVENTLTLEHLERWHFQTALTCHASNNYKMVHLNRTLTLDMNLKPVQVRFLGAQRPLSAKKKHKVQCEVLGSRPTPEVTWYLGSVPLNTFRVLTTPQSNITTSTLHITPTLEDNGKVLTCRAVNPLVANSTMETKWTLDIHDVPVAKLNLGGDEHKGVEEGSDVNFDCNVQSNPWVNKVIWSYNGKRLYNNSTMGTIVTNQSLVLHSVTRERTGSYMCVAENDEGYGETVGRWW